MKIKIALCDDDARALPVISGAAESAFQAQGIQAEIHHFSSGKELLKAMEETRFQLLLLDIEMPGMDGIAIGKALREKEDSTKIVYVSEAESRVFESFQVQPLGFVRKSNFLNDIAAVVELYKRTSDREQDGDLVEFTTRTGLLTLRSKHIRYIEGSRNYQLIYVDEKREPMEVKMTMERLEQLTEPLGFIRVHKGYLVNCQFIQHISSSEVVLVDGVSIPIGRSEGEVPDPDRKIITALGQRWLSPFHLENLFSPL